MDKIQVVCRDFLNGVCRFGDRCRFLHILPQESKIKICYDFLNSTCKFGKRCRFSHEFGNEKPRLNTSSSNIDNSQNAYSFEDSAFSSNIGNSQDITLNPNPRLNTSSSNIGNSQDEYSFEDSAFSSINISNSQDRALNKEPRLNVSSSSSSSSRSIRNSQDRALNKEPRLNVSSSSSSSSSNIRNSQDEILNPKTKPCYNFSKGTCSFGDACMFSHKPVQIFGKTVQIGSIRVKMEDGLKVVKILNDMDDSLLILTYYPNTWVNIVKIHDDILRLSHGQYIISLKKIEFNKRRLMLYFNYLDNDIENFFRSLTMCIEHKVLECKTCNPRDFDKFYIDKYINNCHEVIVKNTTISSVDNYLKKHNIIPLLVLPIKGTRNFTIRFEYQADTEKLIFDTKAPFAIEMGDFIVIHIKPEILNVIGGQIIEDYIKESIPKKDFKSIVMPKIQVGPDKSNIRIIGGNLIGRMKIRQIISNLNKPDIIKVNDCVLKHIDNPLICTFIGMTNCIISINYGKILVYGIENDRRIVVTTIERYLELEDNKYSKIRFDITKAEKNLVIAANNERQIKGCQHFKKYVKDSNIRYIYVFEGTAKSVTDTLCMMTRILGPDGYKYILHDEDIESTQECVACFSSAINPVTLSCGCVHCKDCFKRQLLFDSRPSVNCVCNTPITLKDIALAELTDPEKEQVYNIRLNIFIQSTNVYKYCLTPNCEQLFIPSGNKLFNCRKCSAIYCITCDSPYVDYNLSHEGMSCSAFQSLKKTDHEYLAWVRDHTKPCANCGSNIEKNGGCNHMTCKCKYEFCYLCNRKWKAAGCTVFGATCDLTKN